MNLRFFIVEADTPFWYFGGGYDLTPCYPIKDDVVNWHETARQRLVSTTASLKRPATSTFICPTGKKLEASAEFSLMTGVKVDLIPVSISSSLLVTLSLPAYLPILSKRKDEEFAEAQREFQLYRRGRYAEFNLAIDRGTKYGLQSGRRVESVLASLPPLAKWIYNYQAEPNSPEAKLTEYYLKPQDWLGE